MLGADTLEERDNLDLPTVRSSLPSCRDWAGGRKCYADCPDTDQFEMPPKARFGLS